jgi:hypothetical protein
MLVAGLAMGNMDFAQNNALTIKGAAYVIIHGGGTSGTSVRVIVNQSNYLGITQQTANQGGIISEGEWNYIQWNLGTSTSNPNAYTIPYVYYDGSAYNQIPFSMNITGAGVGGSNMLFSTYHTASWDNTPYATYNGTNQISNVNLQNTSPGVDDSKYLVDRWWIVDALSYATKPTTTMSFSYVAAEAGGSNLLAQANLEAQPYNSTAGHWDPTLLYGSYNAGPPLKVIGASPPAADLFRAWVLVDKTEPLPIELLSFNAVCEGNKVSLTWSTASETNNDYFTIERSDDAQTWVTVATIPGAGNSNTTLYYSAIDNQPYPDYTYYRLKQTDYNGAFTYSKVVVAGCGTQTPFNIVSIYQNQQGNIILSFSADEGEQYTYVLYDIRGRLLQNKSAQAVAGMNEVHIITQGMSEGIYIVTLQNETKSFSKKIFLSDQY